MAAERLRQLSLAHGDLRLPAFLPVATLGVVRAVDSRDLERAGVEGLVMNTFHLMQRPGSSTIRVLGGLHRMTGWNGPIVTDSGGFQAYSLISENPRNGRITDNGVVFRHPGGRRFQLTPEKSVQLQLAYGADVVICLDDCTHPDAPQEVQEAAVRRTVAWAKRCRDELERGLAHREGRRRPLLFGVIQGGASLELRRRCAESLLELGFDGYGYGGWPLDAEGRLLREVIEYTRELVPRTLPMHALGIGHPANVVACARMGYDLFDSAMPTRDARHARLYALSASSSSGEWLRFVYAGDARHVKVEAPVDTGCDCACCERYSLGYLHHLFKLGDPLFPRLATIHNLRTMTRLTAMLREELDGG